ncbi:MAG: hypothetical protein UU72_C0037G0017 [candidate division WWE3 bacterium GW2011_GWB1_41_6]|uniref:Uncharacterized protein n=1 Tax=candidate division WWE3 bacterium GW2011_GWB1_41_6 TaxID=1619112 RepID=A0A0G0WRI0_UNCKA|nr:MAG: hypothetical protein UU72_C0037G0017 [candidate division WWE3 bacterium GW2011_GWB1_41_6]
MGGCCCLVGCGFGDLKKLGILGAVAWILLPTGTPDDVLTYAIIGFLGTTGWAVITLGVLALVYYKLKIE